MFFFYFQKNVLYNASFGVYVHFHLQLLLFFFFYGTLETLQARLDLHVLEVAINAYKAISNGYKSVRKALNTELLVLFVLVVEEVVNLIFTTLFP